MITLKQLKRELADAESVHRLACRSVFRQREVAEKSRSHDIYVRAGAANQIPPPRGAVDPPPSKTQIDAKREKLKLEAMESQSASAGRTLAEIRAALLEYINRIITAERERLAADPSDAAYQALRRLCPDETHVRLDQRFTLSAKVQDRLARGRGTPDAINISCAVLQMGVDDGWDAARANVIEQYELRIVN